MSSYYRLGNGYYTMGDKRFKPPKQDENILRLPSHIALDILSRLPVKAIIHCSCVCKAWRSLLLDPCFPNLHLAKSPVNLMVSCGTGTQFIEFEKGLRERKRKMSKFNGVDELFVVGSCNGLLCLTDSYLRKFYVSNPVKDEYIILPKPNIEKRDPFIKLSGFGFCPSTNVYKVIRLVRYSGTKEMDSRDKAMCEVCTLGSNAWRVIEDVPDPHDGLLISQMSLNGALHWICSSSMNGENSPPWVCAFRIEDEKWDPILLPLPILEVPDEELLIPSSLLGVLKNCLVFLDISHDFSLDIWMMKDYGVRESWTKCWSIEHQGIEEIHVHALLPLRLLKDGDVLLYDRFNRALVCFNPRKRLFGIERIRGVSKLSRGIAHVASFISLANVMKEEC